MLFTPALAKRMEDEGTFVDRESVGSGSLDSLSTLRHKHSLNSQTLLRQMKSKLVPSRNEDPFVRVQIPFDKGLFHSTLAVSGTRVQHSGENDLQCSLSMEVLPLNNLKNDSLCKRNLVLFIVARSYDE